MSIGLTDELEVKTKKGKLAAAKQVFLEGDQENLQQIGDKTHQLENAVKDITATGGASTANAVSYSNEASGMTAVTAQGAIDELAAKNKSQDAAIATKAEKADMQASVSELKAKNTSQDAEIAKKANSADVNTELDKKFNKEDIAQDFGESKNKVVSQFALPYRYIQNEEFIFAKVDTNDKLLFGIEWDGTPKFGKTSAVEDKLQAQVNLLADKITTILGDDDTTSAIDTLKELKNFFASIDNTQTLTSILANLNSVSTKLGEDIKNLQDTKVDKEEGKSLIEDEVKEHFRVIENEEFLKAVVDSEDRVLYGFYRATGEPYYPLNEMYHVEQNEEFFAAWITTNEKVVLGIRRDGEIIGEIHAVNALKQVIAQLQADLESLQEKVGTIDTNLKELLDVFSLQENPEYMAVEKDADGRVLAATNPDGSHYAYNMKSETIDAKVDKEEGKSLINEDVADAHSTLEDPEGRTEITLDADGKVMSYRDSQGKKHEHDMQVTNLDVSNLNLQGNSVNDIIDSLKANGFDTKHPMDWSDSDYVQIPIPRCAKINLLTDTMPTAKSGMGISGVNCDIPCYAEFWDMQGNYFKIPILLSAQGDSSMAFPKKNLAIDMFNDEDRRNSFSVKFGDWVSQDSYHLKAYYTDFFRGVGAVSYMLYEEMANTRAIGDNRPYKHLYTSLYQETDNGGSQSIKELDKNMDTGAKCFPQGFPVIVYQNGEFYGVYSWQLKKHRDNMHQDKKTAEHIHLDGTLGESTIFGGKINWSAFEVRNPKNLYYQEKHIINNKETLSYNGDYPFEIMGEDSEFYNASNKDMVRCAKVKGYIVDLSNRIAELKQAVSDGKSNDEIKGLIDKYFNASFLIDYILETNLGNDGDGYNKNWQWTTYNGTQWNVNPYDHDGVFGGSSRGTYLVPPPETYLISDTQSTPVGWVIKYFKQELNDRWKELRDKGVFETKHITSMLADWCSRIGYDNWKKEYAKWNESPCNRSSHLNDSYWSFKQTYVQGWSSSSTYRKDYIVAYDRKGYRSLVDGNVGNVPLTDDGTNWEDITYSEEKAYSSGDTCVLYVSAPYIFKCTEPCSGQPPVTKFYTLYPRELGHFDSIYRVQRWIEGRMSSMDKVLEYTNN